MAQKEYDVIIVGSGHSGGMSANILTKNGLSCLMLNAGPQWDYANRFVQKPVYDLPYHGFGKPGRLEHCFQSSEFTANQWVDEQENPYTTDPKEPYNWVRVRLLGGRSLFWAQESYRLSDFEFNAAEIDGGGDSWPIRLADVAPYYSRVEKIFRVTGRKEGLPQYPDGDFIEVGNGNQSTTMKKITDLAAARKIPTSVGRRSMGVNGLASSMNLLLPEAMESGKLDIVTNAVVREVTIDKNTGKANGVHFVDRHSRREMHVKAKAVVLAAGTLESTRLLLNSKIANSSGQLGHWLHDQIYGVNVYASVPEALDGKGGSVANLMGGNAVAPRVRNLSKSEKNGFIKGYLLKFSSGGSATPNMFPLYGQELQDKLDHYQGSLVNGTIYGERVARFENKVTINPTVVDTWGIPVLDIQAHDTDNERKLAKDAADTAEEIFKAAGWNTVARTEKYYPCGYSIHEVGTARMGDNPKTSVLNKFNQSHDIKNLFVVDGSCFVTCGWQNPTMTILALSMRASEYLVDQLKQGKV